MTKGSRTTDFDEVLFEEREICRHTWRFAVISTFLALDYFVSRGLDL